MAMNYFYLVEEQEGDRTRFYAIDLEDLVKEEIKYRDLGILLRDETCCVLNASRTNWGIHIDYAYLFCSLDKRNRLFSSNLFSCKVINGSNVQRICIDLFEWNKCLVFSKERVKRNIICKVNGHSFLYLFARLDGGFSIVYLHSIYRQRNRYFINFCVGNFHNKALLKVKLKIGSNDVDVYYEDNAPTKVALLDKKDVFLNLDKY